MVRVLTLVLAAGCESPPAGDGESPRAMVGVRRSPTGAVTAEDAGPLGAAEEPTVERICSHKQIIIVVVKFGLTRRLPLNAFRLDRFTSLCSKTVKAIIMNFTED